MNGISRMKHEQIVTLWQAGKDAQWIGQHLGIHRETVSVHLKQEGFELPLGRPPTSGRKPQYNQPVGFQNRQLSGKVPADPKPPGTPSACEAYREFIEAGINRGQSAQVIWQDLVDECSFSSGYDSVKRFVRKLKRKAPAYWEPNPRSPKSVTRI